MKFKRQDYFKHKRLKIKWKRPKGRQSKLRVKKSGSGMKVSIGYGSPKKEKPVLIKGGNVTFAGAIDIFTSGPAKASGHVELKPCLENFPVASLAL